MRRKIGSISLSLAGIMTLLFALLALAGWSGAGGATPAAPSGGAASVAGAAVDAAVITGPNGITSGQSYKNDVSPALRTLKPLPPFMGPLKNEKDRQDIPVAGHKDQADAVVQTAFHPFDKLNAAPNIAAPITNWNCAGSAGSGSGGCNCAPPDTNGDVGPNHYVQSVNSAFQIWNKTGTSLYGPANINTLWSGFGGACQANNDGDPVVLYDSMADRWMVSQFTASSPYNECIAISQTGDPTGAWYRYAFQLSTTDFPDYPHFGVWPDGYYMSVNQFNNGSTYAGPRPYVFDRAKMLTGAAATFQTTSSALGSTVSPIHPADLDGSTLPPASAPGYFLGFGSSFKVYKFAVNWTTPAATTWSTGSTITPAAYARLCTTGACVPQGGVNQKLDGLSDRFMNRVAYHNMGTYETLLATHNVSVGSHKTAQGAVRWYEIRNPGATASIYQQGTYAPADSLYRWMGSIAMDKNGDIALGYSVSGSSLKPGIRYTGRLANDALGTMPQGEGTILTGTGAQSGVNRWGDYSNLSIDPVDNCTFWFTTEYNNSNNWYWQTRIASFKLPNCQ